jgi:pSer/pThr/pTyr-binding forkhead associated (FHA) protein
VRRFIAALQKKQKSNEAAAGCRLKFISAAADKDKEESRASRIIWMEPTHDSISAQSQVTDSGELIVLNGRLAGARKALNPSVTVLGRAAGCDVRLNVEGVSPLHCLVAHGAEGLQVRDLDSAEGTLVNGEPITACETLHEDDTLTVGPFRFRVRLPRSEVGTLTQQFLLREMDQLAREKEALRIQAAAVVAQQTALTESEAKLEQRRAELQRQEEQLAAHLEEKRAKLLELQNQVREARNALRKEREEHDASRTSTLNELDQSRKELAAARQQSEKEKRRLAKFAQRLQQRYQRQWAGKEQSLRQREDALVKQRRELEKATGQLHQDRAALVQARLRFNGEVELGRRQLQAGWNELQQQRRLLQEQRAREQADAQSRRQELDRRARALADAEHHLADERLRWEDTRYLMERELAGLNTRARNQRRKLLDLDHEAQRLESALEKRRLQGETATTGPASAQIIEVVASTPDTIAAQSPPEQGTGDPGLALVPSSVPGPLPPVPWPRVAALERLASELAEQRVQVAEQCERVLWAHQRWTEEQRNVLRNLEEFGLRLADQERELQARAQAVEQAEGVLRQHQAAADHLRNHLEGWQARLSTWETTWRAERERLLTQVEGREELVRRQLGALTELRKSWGERRKQETKRLQSDHDSCLTYRQQYVALWEDYLRKTAAVEQQQRGVAEQALALEQYRLEVLGSDANTVAVERRLERLQRRWAALSETSDRQVAAQRQALEAEMARLKQYAHAVRNEALAVTRRDEELALRQAEWEQHRQMTEAAQDRLRQQLQALEAEREQCERHLEEQRQELERLARSLLEEEAMLAPTLRAAA